MEYYSDSDTASSVDREALEYERHAREEEDRRIWLEREEAEQQVVEQRLATKRKLESLRENALYQSMIISQQSIITCTSLQAAVSRVESSTRSFQKFIFGVPNASLGRDKVSIKWTKKYLVGALLKFFRFAREAGIVTLEEVVNPDEPAPLFFDIEIKQVGNDHLEEVQLSRILKEQCYQSILDIPDDFLDQLAAAYKNHATTPFSEGECVAGLRVMKCHITETMEKLGYPGVRDFACTSGCRATKFSVHAVSSTLYCDSSVLSMPLVVFEIARAFTNNNLRWLYENRSQLDCDEARFRLRAVMAEKLVHNPRADAEESLIFCGFNDGPYDEAVYSPRHLMRAPGSTKGDASVCALTPLDSPSARMITEEKDFSKLFPVSDCFNDLAQFDRFCTFLINKPLPEAHAARVTLLTGWKPSNAYPKKRNFYVEHSKRNRPVHSYRDYAYAEVRGDNPRGRYVEERHTKTKQRQLTSQEKNIVGSEGGVPKLPVFADEYFTSEDGEYKAFKRFKVNEFLKHVHNGVEENSASAKVFPGGFHCFGCGCTYGYVKDHTRELEYPYLREEIRVSEDHREYMPNVDWALLTRTKKFVVMDAPMGSGKTEQLTKLLRWRDEAMPDSRVCVVSFRQFLAVQQADRLFTECYLNLSNDELSAGPDWITICLNSLWKLSVKSYDVVIIDECGLVRRHFMSSTCNKQLDRIYRRFVPLIRDASLVVLCQDGVSLNDVQFYTEVDGVQANDKECVACVKFEKPLVIHPIYWTDDVFDATRNLFECYRNAFTEADNGELSCVRPFMVFCSQVNYAEFLVEQLQEAARSIGAKSDRIKGIWASIKQSDPFCQAFGSNTNAAVLDTDVIVCTSVVGAGFSVACHFHGFHAFLFTNILEFTEEQQFIRRLRYVIDDLPTDAVRDSYLFVEKGYGVKSDFAKILEDYRMLRADVSPDGISQQCKVVLEETQARCIAERRESRAKHDKLWEEWGKESACSTYQKFTDPTEEQKAQNATYKELLKKWTKGKTKHIADMVKAECDDTGDTDQEASSLMRILEMEDGWSLYRKAHADEVRNTLKSFVDENLAIRLLYKRFPVSVGGKRSRDSNRTDIVGNPNRLSNHIQGLSRLVMWLEWVYRDLHLEERATFWNTALSVKQYASTSVQKTQAFFICMEELLMDMLCSTEANRDDYLRSPGTTPFFGGMSFVPVASLCRELHKRLEFVPNLDDNATKKTKERLRASVRTVLGEHQSNDMTIVDITTCPKKAKKFVKSMLTRCGLCLTAGPRIEINQGDLACTCCNGSPRRYRPHTLMIDVAALRNDMALIFAMKEKRQIRKLIGKILDTPNLSEPDMDLLREAAELYNEVAAGCNVDDILTLTEPRSGTLLPHAVIARRRREHRLETEAREAIGIHEEPQNRRRQRQRTDVELRNIHSITTRVNEMEAEYIARVEAGRRQAARDQEVPEESSVVSIGDESDERQSLSAANPYIDIAARED